MTQNVSRVCMYVYTSDTSIDHAVSFFLPLATRGARCIVARFFIADGSLYRILSLCYRPLGEKNANRLLSLFNADVSTHWFHEDLPIVIARDVFELRLYVKLFFQRYQFFRGARLFSVLVKKSYRCNSQSFYNNKNLLCTNKNFSSPRIVSETCIWVSGLKWVSRWQNFCFH